VGSRVQRWAVRLPEGLLCDTMADSAHTDRDAIIDVVNRYAEACDRRNWPLFDEVFTPDAFGDYGPGYQKAGRDAIVAMVASTLGGCGPTQHLLGNYGVTINGDMASASCKVRAFHVGVDEVRHLSYECFGEYHDRLVRTEDGWRINHRRMIVTIELGTQEVLRPAPAS
jgi:hypothetical protein